MVNKNSKYYKNGINKNTYDMLFPDFYNIKKEEKFSRNFVKTKK